MWLSTAQDSQHLETVIAHNSSIGTKWTKAWVTFNTPNDGDIYYMKPFIYNIGDATVWLANAKVEEGNKVTDWSPAPEDIDASIALVDGKFANYSTTSDMNSAINQKANEITSTVSETYATKTALNTVDGKFADYSTTSDMNSAINQKSDSILSTVSSTYATKSSVTDLSNNLTNNYSTTSAMNSAINQKANEITSSVSQTYATKSEFNNLNVGGRNFVINSGFKGVVPNTQIFPHWDCWGDVMVFGGKEIRTMMT